MIFGCNITLGFKRCATVNFETFSKGPRNQDRKTGRDRRNRFRPPFGHSTKKVSHKNLDDDDTEISYLLMDNISKTKVVTFSVDSTVSKWAKNLSLVGLCFSIISIAQFQNVFQLTKNVKICPYFY